MNYLRPLDLQQWHPVLHLYSVCCFYDQSDTSISAVTHPQLPSRKVNYYDVHFIMSGWSLQDTVVPFHSISEHHLPHTKCYPFMHQMVKYSFRWSCREKWSKFWMLWGKSNLPAYWFSAGFFFHTFHMFAAVARTDKTITLCEGYFPLQMLSQY